MNFSKLLAATMIVPPRTSPGARIDAQDTASPQRPADGRRASRVRRLRRGPQAGHRDRSGVLRA